MLFILRTTIMSLLCFYHDMHSFLLRLHMHCTTDISFFYFAGSDLLFSDRFIGLKRGCVRGSFPLYKYNYYFVCICHHHVMTVYNPNL